MKNRLLYAALIVAALAGCSPSPTENAAALPGNGQSDVTGRDPLPAAKATSSDSTGRGPNTFGSGN